MRWNLVIREIIEPSAEVLQCIHHAVKIELHLQFFAKESFTYDLFHRAVCGVIVIEWLLHRPNKFPLLALAQARATVLCGGTQVNQYAIWLENAVCLGQGMNHALMRHSSEDP